MRTKFSKLLSISVLLTGWRLRLGGLITLELGNVACILRGTWIDVGAIVGNERRKKAKGRQAIFWLTGNGLLDELQNQGALNRHAPSPVLGQRLENGGNV
jgi:hypothetical protein